MLMLRKRLVERRAGSIGTTAIASMLFCAAQGCAQLPFGHSTSTGTEDSIVSTAAPGSSGTVTPAMMVASADAPDSAVRNGSLVQTMTMPGTSAVKSDAMPPHMALGIPAAPPPAPSVAGVTTIPVGASAVVKAEMKKYSFHSKAEEERYNKAAAKFPAFCHDWQRMLHDRESNNLSSLTWQQRDGLQSATYTGYGEVDGCEIKESTQGVPIGKISYMEMLYNVIGKTPDEARHSPPKVVHKYHTMEIFSWEKDKWFY